MLILTRKQGQAIAIGGSGEINITLIGFKGNQARIGIEAPKNIPVYRQEVFQELQQQKEKNHDY